MLVDPGNGPNDEADKWRHRQPGLSPDERSQLNRLLIAVANGSLDDDIRDTSIDPSRLAFAKYLYLTRRINEGT